MVRVEADADRGRSENFRPVDEKRRGEASQCGSQKFLDLMGPLNRIEQEQEFVAADPRQHVGFAQVAGQSLRDLDQQRIADAVAVIVVDVLEIVDVEEGERESGRAVVARQQAVGAMFDHAPRRQVGQFVVVGRAEQLVFKGFLFTDVGGARDQKIAVGDTDRPVRGEQHLSRLSVVDAFLDDRRSSLAQQFEAAVAALLEMPRRRH
jgi:hypothetical protein